MKNFASVSYFWNRLVVKQALATLLIAVISGAAISLWELAYEWHSERAAISEAINRDLSLVRASASEAAFQLSQDLGREVVQGFSYSFAVLEIRLTDNFGTVLGQVSFPKTEFLTPVLTNWLMGDVVRYSLELEARGLDGNISKVGVLDVLLDCNLLTRKFAERVEGRLLTGMFRAVLISFFVVLVFHRLITSPLLAINGAIGRVNPVHPAVTTIPTPAGHDKDELGDVVATVNGLLYAFQSGLNDRDKAEKQLFALARDLESRVMQRTEDLERANQSIHDGIRYAARLQQALLPTKESLSGIVEDWVVGWHPLDKVGGDFYWAGNFGGKGVVALMDCTGHGVPGAFMSAVVASALSRVLHHQEHDDPARILVGLNRLVKVALHQNGSSQTFFQASNDGLEAAVCVIDPVQKQVSFAGAGLGLVVQNASGNHLVAGDKASLGYVDSPYDQSFKTTIVAYEPGDRFIMCTDGMSDQVGGPERLLLGRRRLEAILGELASHSLQQQHDLLMHRLAQWRGVERQRDDMTYLAFQV
jgi:two-component system, sensor histidine kinase SagS